MSRPSILGSSHRVGKQREKKGSAPPARALASWSGELPRGRAGESSGNWWTGTSDMGELRDRGLATVLAGSQAPRDIPQAMMHAQASMFSALPERGISAALSAAILARRASVPPMVSAWHLQALLSWTPTSIERETAALVQAGTLRRVVVPGRGALGEVFVLAVDLERMLRDSGVDEAGRNAYAQLLREHPTAGTFPAGSLGPSPLGALVRAGFLTSPSASQHTAAGASIFARPEDRSTLISLATVAKAAFGTIGAAGGGGGSREYVLISGPGAGAGSRQPGSEGSCEYRVAIPGAGAGLKLVAAALAHLKELLARLPSREASENTLREKWNGGTAKAGGGRQLRGGRVGVPAGRTRRWKEFGGLRFDWILVEAIGSGLVEVFETGCVGRGVRLVSPS